MDKATGLGKTQILEEIRISDLQYTLPIQDHNNNNSNSTNMRRLISVFLENSWHLLLSGSHFMLESIVYSFPRIKLIIYYIWLISLHSSAHILYQFLIFFYFSFFYSKFCSKLYLCTSCLLLIVGAHINFTIILKLESTSMMQRF